MENFPRDLACLACLGKRVCQRGLGPCRHCYTQKRGSERCIAFPERFRAEVEAVQREVARSLNAQTPIPPAVVHEAERATKGLKRWRVAHGMTVATQNAPQAVMRREHRAVTLAQQAADQAEERAEDLEADNANLARMHDRELDDNESLRRTATEVQSDNVALRASNAALLREVEELRAELALRDAHASLSHESREWEASIAREVEGEGDWVFEEMDWGDDPVSPQVAGSQRETAGPSNPSRQAEPVGSVGTPSAGVEPANEESSGSEFAGFDN